MTTAAANPAACKAAWNGGLAHGSATNPHATTTPEFAAWNHGARCWSWAETWDAIDKEQQTERRP